MSRVGSSLAVNSSARVRRRSGRVTGVRFPTRSATRAPSRAASPAAGTPVTWAATAQPTATDRPRPSRSASGRPHRRVARQVRTSPATRSVPSAISWRGDRGPSPSARTQASWPTAATGPRQRGSPPSRLPLLLPERGSSYEVTRTRISRDLREPVDNSRPASRHAPLRTWSAARRSVHSRQSDGVVRLGALLRGSSATWISHVVKSG